MIGSLKTAALTAPTRPMGVARSAAAQESTASSPTCSDGVQLSSASETSAAAPVKSKLTTAAKGALLAAGLATALMAAAPASAQPYGYGYGPGQVYGGGYGHHHRGGGNAGAVIGGAILGAIIGGAIVESQRDNNPPVIYQQGPPVYVPVPVREPYRQPNGALVCPDAGGGWYVSPNPYRCY